MFNSEIMNAAGLSYIIIRYQPNNQCNFWFKIL